MIGEFSGLPLAIGSVKGVRSFSVDHLGRLTGVNYPAVWKPGENLAECYKPDQSKVDLTMGGYTYSFSGQALYPFSLDKLTPNKTDHTMDSCLHGYYAYYDGSDDYRSDARLSAVVEGYGETIIGSRGFRASKAKILALCIPGRTYSWPFENWFRNHGWAPTAVVPISITAVTFLIITTITTSISAAEAKGSILLPILLALGALVALLHAVASTRAEFFYRHDRECVPKEAVEKIKRNYPDVAIFKSFKKMIKAFPPDTDLGPTPLTVDGFWEQGQKQP